LLRIYFYRLLHNLLGSCTWWSWVPSPTLRIRPCPCLAVWWSQNTVCRFYMLISNLTHT
jgi:hypothetical protein